MYIIKTDIRFAIRFKELTYRKEIRGTLAIGKVRYRFSIGSYGSIWNREVQVVAKNMFDNSFGQRPNIIGGSMPLSDFFALLVDIGIPISILEPAFKDVGLDEIVRQYKGLPNETTTEEV